MLEKKRKHEMIKSYEERKSTLLNFLNTIAPKLVVVISPLEDIYGPSVVEKDIDGIVVSLETLVGAKMINKVRQERGLKPLVIFTVNRSSNYNLSSTFIRDHLSYSSLFFNQQRNTIENMENNYIWRDVGPSPRSIPKFL